MPGQDGARAAVASQDWCAWPAAVDEEPAGLRRTRRSRGLDNTEPAIDALIALPPSLAASGTYYINDASDAEADRLHPTKRNRPVASGVVPVAVAYVGGAVLLVASVALAFAATPSSPPPSSATWR